MIIELTSKEKKQIGKLCKYFRKKNKTKWDTISNVISSSLYNKIEKGYEIKNQNCYDVLFDFYSFKFVRISDFYEWIENYINRLVIALCNFEKENLSKLRIELNDKLYNHQNEIIYHQYYKIINYIFDYYCDTKYMEKEEIEDSLLLIQCMEIEEDLLVYLIETVFVSNYNYVCDYRILTDINEHLINYNHPILLYIKGLNQKIIGEFEEALNMFEMSVNYWENNSYRNIKALLGQFEIYKNISLMHADKIAQKLIIKKKQDIETSLIPIINYNVGMYYYLNDKY